jgi:3-hydroxyacyl-CoA dehydrogenase / 3-hydroxy-2-methylbutyryl-CoA dehydrogenase
MTLPLARDLSRFGVRVVTIAPGAFKSVMTDRMPEKARAGMRNSLVFPRRLGAATEFAQTVMWIISCSYVNGETIRINGGARLNAKL